MKKWVLSMRKAESLTNEDVFQLVAVVSQVRQGVLRMREAVVLSQAQGK